MLFSHNIDKFLSIDETAHTNGELYTIITNKNTKDQKGTLVVMTKGTCSDQIIEKIPISKRRKVKEMTLDMATSMNKIVNDCFLNTIKVIGRFYVQKLAYSTL